MLDEFGAAPTAHHHKVEARMARESSKDAAGRDT